MLHTLSPGALLGGTRPISLRRNHLGQASSGRPKGIIGKFDASDALLKLRQVADKAPECWEGEDLTAAQGLILRLETFSTSPQAIMGLSEEEEEILDRGLNCSLALERTAQASSPAASVSSGISPIVPIGIAAGAALALFLLLK